MITTVNNLAIMTNKWVLLGLLKEPLIPGWKNSFV